MQQRRQRARVLRRAAAALAAEAARGRARARRRGRARVAAAELRRLRVRAQVHEQAAHGLPRTSAAGLDAWHARRGWRYFCTHGARALPDPCRSKWRSRHTGHPRPRTAGYSARPAEGSPPAPGAPPPRRPRGVRARLELQALEREHAAAQEEAERGRGVRGLLAAGRAQAAGAAGQQAAQLGEQRQQVVRAGQRAQLLRHDARRPRACARRQIGLRARGLT